MTRGTVLGVLIAIGAASAAVRGYQQPAADAPKVIEVDTVKPNLFVLKGGGGADQIVLCYFGPGRTNGDAWVVFPALGTMHIGDIFASKGLPLIDAANGGSVLHIHESLNKGYNTVKGVDTVINGHSNTTTT